MPFASVPCYIWLAHTNTRDAYGNTGVTYADVPDITTFCCYAPGNAKPDTQDDIEVGRPYGANVAVTFYLPKNVTEDLRDALISCADVTDPVISGRRFKVVGEPHSYMRDNTPGDYSIVVDGVEYLG